ncbi:MAG TPA: YlmC/YmxH family sporulation protein [Oscillospiraceae bacterium]|nr:YlmC/YmxH family sporulation protein [Oscillospiraceae bacterium]HNW04844.1 YlmC/YmxH family sporulation protein [Oscillospiraceae bacterium]HPV99702.1 YlmC/YmxH family sporulation protein [Oscillospiraceae bacterium]
MRIRMGELRMKEVINLNDGASLGYIEDMLIDTESEKVMALIIGGRLRLFGLLGREEEILIGWEKVESIGQDTILIRSDVIREQKRRGFFASFFKSP